MLQHARRRARGAIRPVVFVQDDVCTMSVSAACFPTGTPSNTRGTRRASVVTGTRFIKHDTYLLIEGVCEK